MVTPLPIVGHELVLDELRRHHDEPWLFIRDLQRFAEPDYRACGHAPNLPDREQLAEWHPEAVGVTRCMWPAGHAAYHPGGELVVHESRVVGPEDATLGRFLIGWRWLARRRPLGHLVVLPELGVTT